MADKSVFTDDEWKALTEAPLFVTLAMVAAGDHGPISLVKEAAAGARLVARPGDRGSANELIAEIAKEAESREARHDVQQHRGATTDAVIDQALADVKLAATALQKLAKDEAAQVGGWLVEIARAVAAAAKGTSENEQATIYKIAAVLGVTSH
jgi:hypothetical protein